MKAYKTAKISANDVVVGTKEPGRYTVSLKAEVESKAVQFTLNYLSKLPSSSAPWARVEFDQTNEDLYYALGGNKLLSFSDRESVEEYFSENPRGKAEKEFYDKFGKHFSTLLVRLKIVGKKRKSVHELCSNYLADKTENNYNALKSHIDSNVANDMGWECNYPSFKHGIRNYMGNVSYAKSLAFCDVQDSYLYLGFAVERNIDIRINEIDNGAPFCIINTEGKQFMPMLDMLWALSQKGLNARFRKSDYLKTKKEGYFSFFDQLHYGERDILHDQVWSE